MPRNDRTGPAGAGPRTGRGLGRCGRSADRTTEVEHPYQDYRVGWFGRRWGGGRGRGLGSGGQVRRRFGMGWRTIEDPAGEDVTPRRQQAFLRRRIRELTAQLDRLNQLFSSDSRDGTQDQE